MLTEDDMDSLRGVTVVSAKIEDRDGGQVLRLRVVRDAAEDRHSVAGSGVLTISADVGGPLSVADESSVP